MNCNVLIVGAGPVGLTMAAELARFGVSVRIIDKTPSRTDKSKALVLWSRTLELLERARCADSFVAAGMKVRGANIVAGDQTIANVRLEILNTPYPYALMLPQSETERLLEAQLNRLGVSVERQVELTTFFAGADRITANIHHADGRDETVNADWMIGCDGAHSTVRHGLGIQFEGDTLQSDWVLADLHLSGVKSQPDELSLYWNAAGVLAMFPITPEGRYRIIADIGPATNDGRRPEPTLEEIRAILEARGPGGITLSDPIWLASFRINERKVADYRSGRVFLAGDAAHVHSPAGGQGMNTGIQDACNLAWKLAMVYKGHAPAEPLLSSYSLERSAVGEQVLKDAGRLTTLAVLKGGVMQSIRNHAASLLFGLTPVRETMANKLAELTIGYPKSPLTQGHKHGHLAPGSRAPIVDPPVGAGDTPRFALFAAPDAAAAELTGRYGNVLEATLRAPLAEDAIVLVRPDGYIAMVAGAGKWDEVKAYLEKIVGQ